MARKRSAGERQKADDRPVIDRVAEGVAPRAPAADEAPRPAEEGEVLQDSIRKEWSDKKGGLPDF